MVYAEAQAKGMTFPFNNHQSTFVVDLNAIPFGSKVAAMMTMELLAR